MLNIMRFITAKMRYIKCMHLYAPLQYGVNMASTSLTPRAHSMHPAAYHPYRFVQKSPTANSNQGQSLFTLIREWQQNKSPTPTYTNMYSSNLYLGITSCAAFRGASTVPSASVWPFDL